MAVSSPTTGDANEVSSSATVSIQGDAESSASSSQSLPGVSSPQEASIVAYREKWLWVLLSLALIAIRIPAVLKGRFWAEDGRVFFLLGRELPWYKTLLYTHAGYLNFVANVAGVLANCVPLKYACRVTVLIALVVQSFPLVLLALSRAPWLQERKLFVASLLFIATIPLCQEVWLTPTNSHFHLTLCTALILALEPAAGLGKWFQYAILWLAPLSGPGSAVLAPLFMLRTLIDKSKARLLQFLCVGLATVLQFLFFYKPSGRQVQHLVTQTTFGIDPQLFLDIVFVKHILSPFLGYGESLEIAQGWQPAYLQGTLNMVPQMMAVVVVFGLLAASVSRSKYAEVKWFFLSAVSLITVGYAGCLGSRYDSLLVGINQRYAFAPQILIELSLLALSFQSTGWTKRAFQSVAVWLLIIGLQEFYMTPSQYAEGPSWKGEIQAWRQDPNYKLRLWPSDWSINLAPK